MARPRVFDTVEQLDEAIEGYFGSTQKPTVTGLALWLGFDSRQSFYDYEKNETFSYTIKRCRLKIESLYEQKLHDQGCTGAIFALKNFGWKDEQKVEHSGSITWQETKNYGTDDKTDQGA